MHRRAPRIVGTLVAVAALGAGIGVAAAPEASAATAAPASASGFADRPLGASRPLARVAPRNAAGSMGALAVLPDEVDLTAWAVTPGDQGMVGSCVAWAIDHSMLGWYSRRTGRAGQPFAPMYTYAQINHGSDNGSYPTDALEVARTQGNDTSAHYSHPDDDWWDQPNAAERANAARYKIKSWQTLFMGANQAGNVTAIKQAIATQHPVAIEMAVRHGFDTLGSSPTDVDDDISSSIRGYHEVLAVGYDATGLIIENSWGTWWADGGFGRLSWRVVQQDVWEGDTISGFAAVEVPKPTPPKVVGLRVKRLTPVRHRGSAVTYRVTWRGAQGTSGAINRYDLWYRMTSGPWQRAKLASPTATSFVLTTHVGHTYRVAVRPRAPRAAGALRYSATFRPPRPRR